MHVRLVKIFRGAQLQSHGLRPVGLMLVKWDYLKGLISGLIHAGQLLVNCPSVWIVLQSGWLGQKSARFIPVRRIQATYFKRITPTSWHTLFAVGQVRDDADNSPMLKQNLHVSHLGSHYTLIRGTWSLCFSSIVIFGYFDNGYCVTLCLIDYCDRSGSVQKELLLMYNLRICQLWTWHLCHFLIRKLLSFKARI